MRYPYRLTLWFVLSCLFLFTASSIAHAATPAHLWSHRYGSTGFDRVTSVVFDASGNIIVAGNFELTLNLGGSDLVSVGQSDVFLAAFNPAGQHLWSERFGGQGWDAYPSLALQWNGNIVMAATFADTASFGGAPLASAGSNDVVVATYT